MGLTDEQILANLSVVATLFDVENEIKTSEDTRFAFNSLKGEWGFDDEFIMKVAIHFGSADEGQYFLNIYDGADDIDEAWETYCDERGMSCESPVNPFKDDE